MDMFSAEYLDDVQAATNDELWQGAKEFTGLAKANVFYELSRRAYEMDDHQAAISLSNTAIAEYLALGEKCPWFELIDAYTINGVHLAAVEEHASAVESMRRAAQLSREHRVDNLQSTLGMLGLFMQFAKQYEDAIAVYQELTSITELEGDGSGVLYTLTHLGTVYMNLELFDEAEACLKPLLESVKNQKDVDQLITLFETYGELCIKQLAYQKAIEYLDKAFHLNQTAGYYQDSYYNKFQIGICWFNLANFKNSISAYSESLKGMRSLASKDVAAIVEVEEHLVQSLKHGSWKERKEAKKISSRIEQVRAILEG
jgi:tetratricopeptide (TPR) repeat protein